MPGSSAAAPTKAVGTVTSGVASSTAAAKPIQTFVGAASNVQGSIAGAALMAAAALLL
jgi:hypothetical protein